MPSFDFHARYGLITYAQSEGLDPWKVVARFTELEGECIVSEETHADGGTHLHVFVDFGRKRRFRGADVFDVDSFHPNIEPSRGSPELGYDYCIKDGNIVAGGLQRPENIRTELDETGIKWTAIVESETRDEFFASIRSQYPKILVTQFPAIQRYADWRYQPTRVEYVNPCARIDYENLEDLIRWSHRYLPNGKAITGNGSKYNPLLGPLAGPRGFFRSLHSSRPYGGPHFMLTWDTGPRSICVYGPSQTGKTVWARSLGRHAYFCGLYSGAEASTAGDHEYAVFDDIAGGIKFFPQFKQWLGGMHQFQIKQLYRDPKLITWGKPSIWLGNRDPRGDLVDETDIEWMDANCIFVNVTNKFVYF